jgi:hypothetical protein
MRALILLSILATLATAGCEKTIKDVKNDRPAEPVALGR